MPEGGNHLKEIRERDLLSIRKLARLSEVDDKTIGQIEKGLRSGNEITRRKILKGLNTNANKTKDYSYEEVFDC